MGQSLSEKRQAENQVVFRHTNERIQKELADLRKRAEFEGHSSILPAKEMPIHFFCECSDENCHERIILKPSKYKELHQNSSQFVLKPGHNVASIERIVKRTKKYIVVEKFMTPPQGTVRMQQTDTDNS